MTTAAAAAAAGAADAATAPAGAAPPAAAPGGPGGGGIPEVPAGMEAEAALLGAIAEVPALARAVARPGAGGGGVVITATLQQRNLPANAQRRYTIAAALPPPAAWADGVPPAPLVGLPQELSGDVQMVSVSPSGRQQVVWLKGNDSASAVLQLWRGGRVAAEVLVPKALHGPLVNDNYFAAGAAWSPDESALVYTAETPAPERTPAWGGPESLKESAGPKSWRGVGVALEDWGELNTGKRPPAPFVFDLTRREVLRVPGLPEEHSVGQPTWCPPQPSATAATATATGPISGLVVVAWPHAAPPSFPRLAAAAIPRKLGVVFCYNRSAHLYHVPLRRGDNGALQFGPGPASRLCPGLDSALSPTFSPAGDALLLVSHQEAVATGTHSATSRMYSLPWPPPPQDAPAPNPPPAPRLLVDIVGVPPSPTAFPGLYTANLPDDGFVGPTTLLLNTQWGAVGAIAAVDTAAAGPVTPVPLTPVDAAAPGAASWSLLSVCGRAALAARAAPDAPPSLHVALLPEDASRLTRDGAAVLRWTPLELGAPGGGGGGGVRAELPAGAVEVLDGIEYRVMRVAPRVGSSAEPFDCLLWLPRKRAGPLPAVIAPHGGPHTAVQLAWYPPYAFLAGLGYAVLCPNYRGSTGYGQAALASLPGAIGRNDVDDCLASLAAAVDAGLVDPARVGVVGGSHGGFLTAHLLGQAPGAFTAGVMRNPVTNISAMVAASDIPDWCYVEVMGSEEGRRRCAPVASPADLAAMYDASPAALVDKVTAPVFLMLGARDRRVPPLDGLQYIGALRGRDVAAAGPAPPTRLIVFPEDSHGLDKPQTEFEQWINAAWWLKTHTPAPAPAAAAAAGDGAAST